MRAYEGDCVVSPAVNGLHNDINREAENVAAKEGVSPVLSCYLSSRAVFHIQYRCVTGKLSPSPSCACFSLLTLPAAAVPLRVMRKKLMGKLAGEHGGSSRRRFLQEKTAVLHPPTTTNRY